MKRRWKKFRQRMEWGGLNLVRWLVPKLPRRVVAGLAKFMGQVVYFFDKPGRAVALANMTAAFGERYSPKQRQRMIRASYCDFARTMLDLFWAPALTPENFRRYMRIENAETVEKIRARGESVVFITVHHGNFEWAGLAMGFSGFPTTIVTDKFKNTQTSAFFKKCRQVSGHCIIPQEASMIRLLKHVRRGGNSGMLVDLNLRPGEAATIIDTFGLKMCVTLMHAVLAQRGPARLVPVEGISEQDGTCRVIFHDPLEIPPEATHREIAQKCWDFFAPIIVANPQRWMWAYRHWRFKPQSAIGNYPFYAHASPEFEELLAAVAAQEAQETVVRKVKVA